MHLNDITIHFTSHFVYFLQVAHFKDGGHWENSWAAWRSKDVVVASFWFSADGCKNGVAQKPILSARRVVLLGGATYNDLDSDQKDVYQSVFY